MEKMIDLKDLLKQEILDLYSAEQQIIEALPLMIDKARNSELKNALQEHLKVTEKQKTRLEELQQMMAEMEPAESNEAGENNEGGESNEAGGNNAGNKKPGFFSRLFGGESQKCKGMEGLISEGEKMMAEEMSPEALDAAIIAGAQKIERYEICGYGTARAYARELNLGEVASKLEETLNEEYEADDLLTKLAVGKLNVEAEFADGSENGGRRSGAQRRSAGTSNTNGSSARSNGSSSTGRSASARRRSTSRLASNGKSDLVRRRNTARSASNGKSSPAKSVSRSTAKPAPGGKAISARSTSRSAAKPGSNGKSASTRSASSTSKASSSKTAARGRNTTTKTGSSSNGRSGAAKSSSYSKRGSSANVAGNRKSGGKASAGGRSKSSAIKSKSSRGR